MLHGKKKKRMSHGLFNHPSFGGYLDCHIFVLSFFSRYSKYCCDKHPCTHMFGLQLQKGKMYSYFQSHLIPCYYFPKMLWQFTVLPAIVCPIPKLIPISSNIVKMWDFFYVFRKMIISAMCNLDFQLLMFFSFNLKEW